MDKIRINKRGDIPITILVVGVLLVCSIAIISFFSSTIKARNSFIGVNLMEQLNIQIEKKIFNHENPAGLYVDKKETKGFLFWAEEVFVFSAKYEG